MEETKDRLKVYELTNNNERMTKITISHWIVSLCLLWGNKCSGVIYMVKGTPPGAVKTQPPFVAGLLSDKAQTVLSNDI